MPHQSNAAPAATKTITRQGGCHCGAVRYEVDLAPDFNGSRCNCSICAKIAQTGTIVKPNALRPLKGEGSLSTYVWGPVATRYFCKHCGIHCYGRGFLEQVGGDYASVNLNTLDDFDVNALRVVHWDGRHDNWMAGPSDKPWPLASAPAAVAST